MVAKDESGKNTKVPGLIIKNQDEVRRFYNCLKQIASKKDFDNYEEVFDYMSDEALLALKKHNIKLEVN